MFNIFSFSVYHTIPYVQFNSLDVFNDVGKYR